jgi:hypothetical protein
MHTLPLLCLLAVPGAEPRTRPDAQPARRLTLTPAKASSPALRYRLLPDLLEQRTADAAPHYRRASFLLRRDVPQPVRSALYDWSDLRTDQLPKEQVRQALALAEPALGEVECGALCESCDWGHTENLRRDGIFTVLDGIQEMRELHFFLLLRMRLDLVEGRTPRALRTARLALAMAQHVAESPTLISCLISFAMATRTAAVLEEVIERPDAPNLYWALTDLPRPFVDLRRAVQGERLGAYASFPGMTQLAPFDAEPLRPEQVKVLADRLIGIGRDFEIPVFNRYVLAYLLYRKHDKSRQALLDAGRPRDCVDRMTPLEVSLLHSFLEYDRELDELMKLQSLPYWEAQPQLEARRKRTRLPRTIPEAMRGDGPALPLAGQFVPAIDKVLMARTRVERRLAALRCIEAVRLYAANHDGQWPARLDDIREVSVPFDPATGKPFDYRVLDGKAYLSGPNVFPGNPSPATVIRYELTPRR